VSGQAEQTANAFLPFAISAHFSGIRNDIKYDNKWTADVCQQTCYDL